MRPGDHYRRIAKECLDLADRTADDRVAQMASEWKQMATQWERISARIQEFAERRDLKYPFGDPDLPPVPMRVDAPDTTDAPQADVGTTSTPTTGEDAVDNGGKASEGTAPGSEAAGT